MVTGRPPAEAEGLRIAATRAGQQNGDDDWDEDLLDEAWKQAPPPKAAWSDDDTADPDDLDEDDGGGRPNGATPVAGTTDAGSSTEANTTNGSQPGVSRQTGRLPTGAPPAEPGGLRTGSRLVAALPPSS